MMEQLQAAKFEYCLMLGDSALILGHRLSEWCGHGPVLEEDIAMINVALDLVGLSRNLLGYAGELEGKGRGEDQLAYLRDAKDYRNNLLVEQENGDFGKTVVRQFLYDVYAQLLYAKLSESKDEHLAAIAAKAIKEMEYHLRHSTQWMLRLGDGTAESHERMQNALDDLWMYCGDLFATTDGDRLLAAEGLAVAPESLKEEWLKMVTTICTQATLVVPTSNYVLKGSREGRHTEQLGFILADLQFVQRAYPGNSW
jgi:ring-1,2-phenylacetyl-CoA epoxidase subunit PaaC